MSVATEPAPEGSLLSLLGNYGEEPDSVDKGLFYARLPKGDKLKCRKVLDAEEMESLGRRAQKWATDQAAKKPEGWIESWRPYYTDNKVLLGKVWLFSQLCLEKDFKHNHLHCLILARKLGPVFVGVLEQINLASTNMLGKEFDEFEEAGNA